MPKPAAAQMLRYLGEMDVKAYGPSRGTYGGPDESAQAFAKCSQDQILGRLRYYSERCLGTLGSGLPPKAGALGARDDLAERLECLLVARSTALRVAGRWIAYYECARLRYAYGRRATPALPPWAARRLCSRAMLQESPVEPGQLPPFVKEYGADGEVPTIDDWEPYSDLDALPVRRAEYSPSRELARWKARDADPSPSAAGYRALGAAKPSSLSTTDFPRKGGAALDAYGYAWGQNRSEAWAQVPLPPGATRRHVAAKLKHDGMLLSLRNQDALLSTPYGRYAANKHPGLRDTLGAPLVDAAFFAQIDSDGSAWFIDEHVVKRRAPLKAVVHKILIVNLKKKKQEFWTHLFHQHPQVHPEDLRALAAEIDGAAK